MAHSRDLRLADGAVVIPAESLHWQFARSGGPGGQNVNKTSTKAVLWFAARDTPHLPDDVRRRLLARERSRLTRDGEIVITSQRFRDQPQNIADCLAKLAEMIEASLRPPKTRRRTKKPRSAVANRLEGKRRRSETKRLRGGPGD